MAKVNPSYQSVAASGIAAGDDAQPDTLAPYDVLRKGGISTSSQATGVSPPAPTEEWKLQYPSMQDPGASGVAGAGADTTAHGLGSGPNQGNSMPGMPSAPAQDLGAAGYDPGPIPTPVHKQAAKP